MRQKLKLDREKVRLSNNGRFRDFDETVRFRGTHLMRNSLHHYHELAVQAAAKSFYSPNLIEHQEMFRDKLHSERWVNGFNDVTEEDFNLLYDEWHRVVMELIDDFDTHDMYEYDHVTEVLEINVARVGDQFIDLEVTIYERDQPS